jgi:endonuclease/exonuclease/phosphatase family metal-dependent hydrolase
MKRLAVPLAFAAFVAGSVAAPAAQAVTTTNLTFATFNVCKTDCAAPAPGWDVRRERVARVINESGADVIGLQEATWQPTAYAKKQVDDIANLIGGAGYVQPTYTKASQQCAWTADDPHKCTHTSALFYKASTVQQFQTPAGDSAGVINEGMIATGLDEDSTTREIAWAYLRGLNGTGPFLAISAHTTTFKEADHEASRVTFASALTGWSDAWNAQHGVPGIPVFIMADLNSYEMRQPAGAHKVLMTTGWVDAATAPASKNDRYSTINYNPVSGDNGWPTKAYLFNRAATRIDYVFGRGNVVPISYEVVMYLNPDGTFNPDYQASDHQMVRAVWGFPTG